MAWLTELIVAGIMGGILLFTLISLVICVCRHNREAEALYEAYEEARLYASRETQIPRVTLPFEGRPGRREVGLEVNRLVLSLPPTYAQVVGNSRDFPCPDILDLDPLQFELPPPTYQEVIQSLGIAQPIQHI